MPIQLKSTNTLRRKKSWRRNTNVQVRVLILKACWMKIILIRLWGRRRKPLALVRLKIQITIRMN